MNRNPFPFVPKRAAGLLLALWLLLTLAACTFVIEPPAAATPNPAPETESASDPVLLGTWQWESGILQGQTVAVVGPERYTLTFLDDGSVGAQFDCNSGGSSYTLDGDNLTFGPMMTTLMACMNDSQDGAFASGLADTVAYTIDGDTLTLTLGTAGDSMTFSRVE